MTTGPLASLQTPSHRQTRDPPPSLHHTTNNQNGTDAPLNLNVPRLATENSSATNTRYATLPQFIEHTERNNPSEL